MACEYVKVMFCHAESKQEIQGSCIFCLQYKVPTAQAEPGTSLTCKCDAESCITQDISRYRKGSIVLSVSHHLCGTRTGSSQMNFRQLDTGYSKLEAWTWPP